MVDMQSVVGSGLNKVQEGLQTGKKKIDVVRELSQLKKEVKQLQVEKALQLTKVGEQAYHLCCRQELSDSVIQEIADKLFVLDRKIWQTQKQIAEVERENNAVACSNCGEKVGAEDKFCGGCGTQVNRQVQETAGVECGRCSVLIEENCKFCPACGVQL
ncbi:MAG: zinc ribbon domain-containing protein [Bacillota bacterium]|nr:zinc ribbon domain-containing protein [Bacillota bacterium]MDW7684703.1 zinc ribbon domain-containing protein [Bacillota bacterium]